MKFVEDRISQDRHCRVLASEVKDLLFDGLKALSSITVPPTCLKEMVPFLIFFTPFGCIFFEDDSVEVQFINSEMQARVYYRPKERPEVVQFHSGDCLVEFISDLLFRQEVNVILNPDVTFLERRQVIDDVENHRFCLDHECRFSLEGTIQEADLPSVSKNEISTCPKLRTIRSRWFTKYMLPTDDMSFRICDFSPRPQDKTECIPEEVTFDEARDKLLSPSRHWVYVCGDLMIFALEEYDIFRRIKLNDMLRAILAF